MKQKVVAGLMVLFGAVALCGAPVWADESSSGVWAGTESDFAQIFSSTSAVSETFGSSILTSFATCNSFLGFYPWYNGLTDATCDNIIGPTDGDGLAPFIWTIVLNVLADLMLAIGYIAVGFVLYGGFLFITAQDDPGRVAKARKTLTYAIVGTIIGILASNIIHAVVNAL